MDILAIPSEVTSKGAASEAGESKREFSRPRVFQSINHFEDHAQ